MLIYGINVLIASLLLSFLLVYIARDRRLVGDEVADETLAAIARRRWAAIGIEVIAILCALIVPMVAVALYLAATLLLLIVRLIRLHRSSGPGAGTNRVRLTRSFLKGTAPARTRPSRLSVIPTRDDQRVRAFAT